MDVNTFLDFHCQVSWFIFTDCDAYIHPYIIHMMFKATLTHTFSHPWSQEIVASIKLQILAINLEMFLATADFKINLEKNQRRSVFPFFRFPDSRCLGFRVTIVRSPSPFLAPWFIFRCAFLDRSLVIFRTYWKDFEEGNSWCIKH